MRFRKRPRIILNDDTCSLRTIEQPHTVANIDRALEHLQDSQVDVLCWCMSTGEVAYSWPSKIIENAYDLAESDRGAVLANKSNETNLMLSLHRQGIDYLPHLINAAHKKGIRFFGSFRMNDAHQKSRPHGMLASTFWREHQDWRLWEVTDGQTYYNATLDYSYAEVRQRKIAAIREVAEMYDVDGIELDFCRNPYTFQPSEAWSKRRILTGFIRKVRAMLDKIGKDKGREIALIIRLPFSENRQKAAGMDVRNWIRKRYMDILVMSCLQNNYNQNIKPWLSLCTDNDILLYPSVEAGPASNAAHNHVVPETVEEVVLRQRAMAQSYLAQGADGVYMFNYPCRLFEAKRSRKDFQALQSVLSEIGSKRTLKGLAKQYTFWDSLPIQLESYRPPQFHQTIHFNVCDPTMKKPKSQLLLRFRQVAAKNPHSYKHRRGSIVPPDWVQYTLNDNRIASEAITRIAQPAGKIVSGFELKRHELIEIRMSGKDLNTGANSLAFFIPRFPKESDPYVYIYELEVVVFCADNPYSKPGDE